MSPEMTALAVGGVVLLLLATWLGAVEAALTQVTRRRAEDLQEDGRRGADVLARLLSDVPAAASTALFGRILCETVAVVAFAQLAARVLPGTWLSLLVASLVLVLVVFVLVGTVGRSLGQLYPEPVALVAAPGLRRTARVVGPALRLLVSLVNRALPGQGLASGPFASEAALLEIVEQAEADSVIERGESLMLQRVVHLGDTVAREVQVPRPDMVVLEQGTGLERALRLHLRSGFSRVPVVGRDADDVVGISYLKDVAAHLQDLRSEGGDLASAEVGDVMRAPVFVPESKPADDLLREMQAGSVHVAVVIDEYGGVSGLVTIEDLLEEIVGQISDEYDVEEPEIEVLDEDRWRLSARTHLSALSEITGRDVEDDDVDTVAGLLAKHLGKVPIRGSNVEVEGLRITADRRGRRNRLLSVVVELLEPEEPSEDDGDERSEGDEPDRDTGRGRDSGRTREREAGRSPADDERPTHAEP